MTHSIEVKELINKRKTLGRYNDARGKYYFSEQDVEDIFNEWQQSQQPESDQKGNNDSDAVGKVTRVEVIDNKGRSYINWDDENKVELSYQDKGRTLKIFITKK